MNTLEQEVVKMLQGVTDKAAQASDFLVAELPDVIQQLLMWKATESALLFALGILLILSPFWYTVILNKIRGPGSRSEETLTEWSNKRDHLPFLFGMFILIPTGLGVEVADLTWLQIWVAPKIYLIEYTASLLK